MDNSQFQKKSIFIAHSDKNMVEFKGFNNFIVKEIVSIKKNHDSIYLFSSGLL